MLLLVASCFLRLALLVTIKGASWSRSLLIWPAMLRPPVASYRGAGAICSRPYSTIAAPVSSGLILTPAWKG